LRRHPEIKWRVKAVDVRHVAELNLQLLKQAAGKVGEHGVITYATCSVLREEDEAVVESFLASPEGADFKLVPAGVNGENYLLTMPVTGGPDIHFAAQFVRR
jgi:16S rRNA (cytosine967-C5)-methyltransferase